MPTPDAREGERVITVKGRPTTIYQSVATNRWFILDDKSDAILSQYGEWTRCDEAKQGEGRSFPGCYRAEFTFATKAHAEAFRDARADKSPPAAEGATEDDELWDREIERMRERAATPPAPAAPSTESAIAARQEERADWWREMEASGAKELPTGPGTWEREGGWLVVVNPLSSRTTNATSVAGFCCGNAWEGRLDELPKGNWHAAPAAADWERADLEKLMNWWVGYGLSKAATLTARDTELAGLRADAEHYHALYENLKSELPDEHDVNGPEDAIGHLASMCEVLDAAGVPSEEGPAIGINPTCRLRRLVGDLAADRREAEGLRKVIEKARAISLRVINDNPVHARGDHSQNCNWCKVDSILCAALAAKDGERE